MTVLAIADQQGREVELTADRWTHITAGHPEMVGHQAGILAAVQHPTRHLPGRRPGEDWYYLENVGPSRWLKVVVAYRGERGSITTAFARRRLP
jgi:hypothetical protein